MEEAPTGENQQVRAAVKEVAAHYLTTMKLDRASPSSAECHVIDDTLAVATPDELKAAITAAERSDWHMKRGEHTYREGSPVNSLAGISRRSRGQHPRERIEWV